MRMSEDKKPPQSWMDLDIRLGALSVHIDEDRGLKGIVDPERSSIYQLMKGEISLD